MPGDNKKSRARNRHSFKVWVEVEELDASGEHYGDVIVPLIGGTFASAEAAKNYAHCSRPGRKYENHITANHARRMGH
jgi:hypothetical protein